MAGLRIGGVKGLKVWPRAGSPFSKATEVVAPERWTFGPGGRASGTSLLAATSAERTAEKNGLTGESRVVS
jgi:hypothetical protein